MAELLDARPQLQLPVVEGALRPRQVCARGIRRPLTEAGPPPPLPVRLVHAGLQRCVKEAARRPLLRRQELVYLHQTVAEAEKVHDPPVVVPVRQQGVNGLLRGVEKRRLAQVGAAPKQLLVVGPVLRVAAPLQLRRGVRWAYPAAVAAP